MGVRLRHRTLAILIQSLRLLLLFGMTSCADNEQIRQQATSLYFTQDYNPQFLDVLWMIDDRSPIFKAKTHLVEQAKRFFTRLDSVSGQYRMAFVSADMQIANGSLKPSDDPRVLTKSTGTIEQRATNFGNIISQIINLKTGWENRGFESAHSALSQHFKPRSGVPLVLVFISDSDDKSPSPSDQNAVDHYAKLFLDLKGGDASMVRVYSINFTEKNPQDPEAGQRCTNVEYSADIDNQFDSEGNKIFEDRYFRLATKLGGETADLCLNFSDLDKIKLNGLSLKALRQNFPLETEPLPTSILVRVSKGDQAFNVPWKYDPGSNEIRFDTLPPEGTTIQITYNPR